MMCSLHRSYLAHGDHISTNGAQRRLTPKPNKKNKNEQQFSRKWKRSWFCPFWWHIRSCFAKFLSICCNCIHCVPEIEANCSANDREQRENKKKQQFAIMGTEENRAVWARCSAIGCFFSQSLFSLIQRDWSNLCWVFTYWWPIDRKL